MSAPRRALLLVAGLLILAAAAAVVFRFAPGSRAAAPKAAPPVPVSVAQIVARTVMDKVTVSRAAQGLVKRRLVARSQNKTDGRSHVLALTSEGRRLYAEIAPLALAYEAALIAGLSPEDVALLKRLLGRLQHAADALTGSAPG